MDRLPGAVALLSHLLPALEMMGPLVRERHANRRNYLDRATEQWAESARTSLEGLISSMTSLPFATARALLSAASTADSPAWEVLFGSQREHQLIETFLDLAVTRDLPEPSDPRQYLALIEWALPFEQRWISEIPEESRTRLQQLDAIEPGTAAQVQGEHVTVARALRGYAQALRAEGIEPDAYYAALIAENAGSAPAFRRGGHLPYL